MCRLHDTDNDGVAGVSHHEHGRRTDILDERTEHRCGNLSKVRADGFTERDELGPETVRAGVGPLDVPLLLEGDEEARHDRSRELESANELGNRESRRDIAQHCEDRKTASERL